MVKADDRHWIWRRWRKILHEPSTYFWGVMWSWSNKCVIEANPTTWSQEAADWALNHPPAPISKREVPKTNRHGFGSSISGIIKWNPIWWGSNLMHYINTWCVTYILDICSLPPTSICKTLKNHGWGGAWFISTPYIRPTETGNTAAGSWSPQVAWNRVWTPPSTLRPWWSHQGREPESPQGDGMIGWSKYIYPKTQATGGRGEWLVCLP